ANLSFRTALLHAHGGFPTYLGRVGSGVSLLSNEEVAVYEAIRASGRLLVYAPQAKVEHLIDARRLTRAWFRKRAAWQAVSDFLLRPEEVLPYATAQWPLIMDLFNRLPPAERGMYVATDDPAVFLWQISAIYISAISAL